MPHNLQGTINIACSENDKIVRPISLREAFWYKEAKGGPIYVINIPLAFTLSLQLYRFRC